MRDSGLTVDSKRQVASLGVGEKQRVEILKVLKGWAKAMPTREKYAPLAACWHREVGGLNKFVHVWAYKRIGASKHFLPL